jgi:nucleoid DNA-binding protein
MTKRDLVVRISQETNLVQQMVLEVIQKTFDYISEALAGGRKVELRNFGVFEVKMRKARVGRNPKAPAADVRIPPRAVVKFKAGKGGVGYEADSKEKRQAGEERRGRKTGSVTSRPRVMDHDWPHTAIPSTNAGRKDLP